jgi:hypothetical protein
MSGNIGISLGFNCDSAVYGVNNNLRKTKHDGYKTCPFDLMVSNYLGVIECIEDNFQYFTDTNYLQIIKSNSDKIFVTNNLQDSIIYHTKYKFIFNHESPGHANLYLTENWEKGINHFTMNNYENFIKRYNNRINNFKNYLKSGNYINFIITRYNTRNINDIQLLNSAIIKNFPDLKFGFIFNNYKDNLWILEHYILMKIPEDSDEFKRLQPIILIE